MGLIKVSGVFGILILIFSLIFITVFFTESVYNSANPENSKSFYDWIEFILSFCIMIFLIIFYLGFFKLGRLTTNNALMFSSLIILIFILLFFGLLLFSFFNNSNTSSGILSVPQFINNVYVLNLVIVTILFFFITKCVFFVSLIDIHNSYSIKRARVTGNLGIISLCLISVLFFGTIINSFIGLANGLSNTQSSDVSSIFVFFYSLIIVALSLTLIILMSLTLFSASKKYEGKNKTNHPSKKDQSLKQISAKSQSQLPIQVQTNKFVLPKIFEREK